MRLARNLLKWFAPAEWRDSMDGDLAEERAARRARGRRAGPLWVVTTVVVMLVSLHLDRRGARASGPRSSVLGGVGMDVRMALRSLRAAPGFSLAALTVLMLGIGASTAIFTVVDAVLLRGLPFDDGHRLVAVGENFTDRPVTVPNYVGSMAAPNFFDWRRDQTVFEQMAASSNASGFTVREGGEPEDLTAQRATANLFDVLRVRPQLGRFFTAEHEVRGRDRVLVISDGLWRRRFGADPAIVGKTMTFDSGVWEIVGVLPRGFAYPVQLTRPVDLWMPYIVPDRERIRDRQKTGRNYNLRVVGRLLDGVTVEQARSEFDRMAKGLASEFPDWFADTAPAVHSLYDSVVGRTRHWMLILLGAVGFVLLIACANVANLMLARATTRSREILVRAALGASRWRIARALLVESLVLSTIGLLGALLLALWGVGVLQAAMPPGIPRLGSVGLDLRVLLVATTSAMVTGLACGLAPAWQLSRPDLNSALREGGRSGTSGAGRQRLRSVLLVAEVAIAVVLLVGAGLFVSSFVRLISIDLGIDHHNVAVASVNPRIASLDTEGFERARAQTGIALEQAMSRLRATPGVEAVAAIASGSPLSGSWRSNSITLPGKPASPDEVQVREVTPGYLDVLKVKLRRGRYLSDADSAGSQLVVVLNEEAVRRYFEGREPLGTTVTIDEAERVVVGIVGNVHVRGPEVPVSPEAYLPMAQRPSIGASVLVRTTGDPSPVVPSIRQAVLEALPGVPVRITTLEESLRGLTEARRFNMLLVGLFGLLAVVIATVGIYGVMGYLVAQRTQEIGVRMALGAQPMHVLRGVLTRALSFMATGLVIGLAGAWVLGGTVEAFLFAVEPHDPIVFLGVGGLLTVTGLLAALIPALRAARVDPVIALK